DLDAVPQGILKRCPRDMSCQIRRVERVACTDRVDHLDLWRGDRNVLPVSKRIGTFGTALDDQRGCGGDCAEEGVCATETAGFLFIQKHVVAKLEPLDHGLAEMISPALRRPAGID